MKILMDTHIFLWFINNDSKLSLELKALIESDLDILISIASLWEISIKVSTGKLTLPNSVGDFFNHHISINDFEILNIEIPHLEIISTLPFHHRDPFDRMLIAQALSRDYHLISVDSKFTKYDCKLV